MEITLLDWTRMGRTYCLAGAIVQAGQYRIVRPMLTTSKQRGIPNQGWSPFLLDGRQRWEIFEMVRPVPASSTPPHLEDVWVEALKPTGRLAGPAQRLAILQATLSPPGKPLFGLELQHTPSSSYLEPGKGERSLATVLLPTRDLHFTALWREGSDQPDYRVHLSLPEQAHRILPVKDHFLLRRAEQAASDVDERIGLLTAAVRQMGERVMVRLGLSRPFVSAQGLPGRCWLMADGFFSPDHPQS